MTNSLLAIFNIYYGDIYPTENLGNKFLGVFTYDAILTVAITLAVVFIAEGIRSRSERKKEVKLNTQKFDYFKNLLTQSLKETEKYVENFDACILKNKTNYLVFFPTDKTPKSNLERMVSKLDHEEYFKVLLKERKGEITATDYFKLFSYLDYFKSYIDVIIEAISSDVDEGFKLEGEYEQKTESIRNAIADFLNLNGSSIKAEVYKSFSELLGKPVYHDMGKYHEEVILQYAKIIDDMDLQMVLYSTRTLIGDSNKIFKKMKSTNKYNIELIEGKLNGGEVEGKKYKGFRDELISFKKLITDLDLNIS